MKHEILGEIVHDNDDDAGVAHVSYEDRTIEIRIFSDEIPYEESVELAASVVNQLEQVDNAAKKVAASDLTDTYNESWNEFEEEQDDGTFKTVTNPKLTEAEFANKLTLHSVNVSGAMLDFFYDDGNMFLGHTVVVNFLDGTNFTDARAELFG